MRAPDDRATLLATIQAQRAEIERLSDDLASILAIVRRSQLD